MTTERMAEQLAILRERKTKFNEEIDKKIEALDQEYELALAAQTQRIFAKHRLSPDELNKLKYANKEQLKRLLAFISEEIEEPKAPAEEKPESKMEKENKDHAKEVTT